MIIEICIFSFLLLINASLPTKRSLEIENSDNKRQKTLSDEITFKCCDIQKERIIPFITPCPEKYVNPVNSGMILLYNCALKIEGNKEIFESIANEKKTEIKADNKNLQNLNKYSTLRKLINKIKEKYTVKLVEIKEISVNTLNRISEENKYFKLNHFLNYFYTENLIQYIRSIKKQLKQEFIDQFVYDFVYDKILNKFRNKSAKISTLKVLSKSLFLDIQYSIINNFKEIGQLKFNLYLKHFIRKKRSKAIEKCELENIKNEMIKFFEFGDKPLLKFLFPEANRVVQFLQEKKVTVTSIKILHMHICILKLLYQYYRKKILIEFKNLKKRPIAHSPFDSKTFYKYVLNSKLIILCFVLNFIKAENENFAISYGISVFFLFIKVQIPELAKEFDINEMFCTNFNDIHCQINQSLVSVSRPKFKLDDINLHALKVSIFPDLNAKYWNLETINYDLILKKIYSKELKAYFLGNGGEIFCTSENVKVPQSIKDMVNKKLFVMALKHFCKNDS